MKWSIVKNDFIRNKVINLALLLFMMFSACLAVLSILMAVQTVTSISELYKTAQPPHFAQMHKGDINLDEISRFMADKNQVIYSQTVTMINIYGEKLTVIGDTGTYDLSDCRLDIGMVKQNESRDLLLNSKHKVIKLEKGEIGIPVILRGMYDVELGDRVILSSNGVKKEFVIKEFVLDSMMNSTMASSTRLLISDEDFEELVGQVGENEYLIEAYFKDSKESNDFKTIYQDGGLPQNGQVVTYSIIFIMSALTDIVTVFIMLLVSILLIFVAFICLKFTIMAALEEEVNEIGTMKAIGLTFSDIRYLYLIKYRVLALVGVIAGYIVALLSRAFFASHISTTFGDSKMPTLALLLSIIIACLVFLLINRYCKKILKIIKKLTVVDALVSGKGFSRDKKSIKDGLHRSKKLDVNWLIGLREAFYQFKNWVIVFAVLVLTILMIMIPVNLLNTFEAPEFITYMGSSMEDILIEVENGEALESNYVKVKEILEQDDSIKEYYVYRTIRAKTTNSSNQPMNLDIDSGKAAGNGLQYLRGEAPEGNQEIAISYLNANEIEKEVGDTILLIFGNQDQEFIISGIYQDVTSGGMTAKSKNQFDSLASVKYSISINLEDKKEISQKADEWSKELGAGVTVDPMKDFINQTLGGVSRQIRTMVYAISVIGGCLSMLITVLFLKLRLAKDSSEIAVLRAVGFSEKDINKQYLVKIGYVSIIGILVGVLLTNLLGEQIVNLALSFAGIGVKKVQLYTNHIVQYLICPLLLLVLVLLVTRVVMRTIKKYNIISIMKE